MKTKATRKHKRRIRGGEAGYDTYGNNYYKTVHDYFKDLQSDTLDFSKAPLLENIGIDRLKTELSEKKDLIDKVIAYQLAKKEAHNQELREKEESDKRRILEGLSCTSRVRVDDESKCTDYRQSTYDAGTKSCYYPPISVNSQRECAAKQTSSQKNNNVYHEFRDKGGLRVVYTESFLDAFQWDKDDKDGLLFYLTTASDTWKENKRLHKGELNKENEEITTKLREILEESILYYFNAQDYLCIGEILEKCPLVAKEGISTKLDMIVAERILYYFKLNDYDSIKSILKACGEKTNKNGEKVIYCLKNSSNLITKLNNTPKKMLTEWLQDIPREILPQDKKSLAGDSIIPPRDVEKASFAYWLGTNMYPELRKRILLEGNRLLIEAQAMRGGRKRYRKGIRKSRARNHRTNRTK